MRDDPSGNWHELDRALIILIGVLAVLRETLASSAYRDIFINYTLLFILVVSVDLIVKKVKNRRKRK